MTTFKLLGINGDLDTCQCCGKKNLKKVVWLDRRDESGSVEVVAYGVNCAALALKIGSARTWTLALQKTEELKQAELRKVHEVGSERSVRTVVIESVGQNGGSITVLGYANGLMSAVQKWAEERWPNLCVMVRWAR